MGVHDLDEANERWFLESIEGQMPDYFWFLVDWLFERERTVIKLAERDGALTGALLIYDGKIAQLRGTMDACRMLLPLANLEKVEFNVPLEMRGDVLERYRPRVDFNVVLMIMHRDEARPRKSFEAELLHPEDAKEITDLLTKADPRWWGEMTEAQIRSTFNKSLWMGVRYQNCLVAVGSVLLEGPGFNITIIATDPGHRNKGLATSVLSSLIIEIFDHVPFALIHVREDNLIARKIYESVGFRPYRTYYLMRGEKIR